MAWGKGFCPSAVFVSMRFFAEKLSDGSGAEPAGWQEQRTVSLGECSSPSGLRRPLLVQRRHPTQSSMSCPLRPPSRRILIPCCLHLKTSPLTATHTPVLRTAHAHCSSLPDPASPELGAGQAPRAAGAPRSPSHAGEAGSSPSVHRRVYKPHKYVL